MKQLINNVTNEELIGMKNYRKYFLQEVSIEDITDRDLRIAVQSYKMSVAMIDAYIKDLKGETNEQ